MEFSNLLRIDAAKEDMKQCERKNKLEILAMLSLLEEDPKQYFSLIEQVKIRREMADLLSMNKKLLTAVRKGLVYQQENKLLRKQLKMEEKGENT